MGFSVSQATYSITPQFGKQGWWRRFKYNYFPFTGAQRPVQNADLKLDTLA